MEHNYSILLAVMENFVRWHLRLAQVGMRHTWQSRRKEIPPSSNARSSARFMMMPALG